MDDLQKTTSLDLLGVRSGTDKSRLRHDYLRHYEPVLAHLKDKPVTLLEIGVHNGASLDMWESYFSQARIVGLDISPNTRKHERDRVDIVIGSQADEVFLHGVGAKFRPDVIIDDGSHVPEHQVLSFKALIGHVNDGGVYIAEDVGPGLAYDFFGEMASRVFLNERPHGITSLQVIPQAFIFKKAPRDEMDGRLDVLEQIARSSRLPAESLLYLSEYMRRKGAPNAESLRVARLASGHNPKDRWIHLLLSRILLEEGDIAGAWDEAKMSAHWAREISGSVAGPIQRHLDEVESRIAAQS